MYMSHDVLFCMRIVSHIFQQLSKSPEAILPFDGPLLIREVTVKDAKHLVIQRVGERTEYQFKFEVSITMT